MIDKNKNGRPDHLELKDTDGDGVIDLYDEDDDNDGIPDNEGTRICLHSTPLHARKQKKVNVLSDSLASTPPSGEGDACLHKSKVLCDSTHKGQSTCFLLFNY